MGRTLSLKSRAFFLSILVVGSVWMVTAWFIYESSQNAVNQLIDDQLDHEMSLLKQNLRIAIRNYEQNPDDYGEFLWGTADDQPGRALYIWGQSKNWAASSQGAPNIDKPNIAGYSEQILKEGPIEHEWRILYEPIDGDLSAATAINKKLAAAYLREIGLQSLTPLVIAILISGIGVILGFSFSWRPMQQLISQVATISPSSLSPITADRIPTELTPLTNALNTLMDRLDRALEREHQFTANAAHELQTPLAAISTEVQLCQRKTDDPEVLNMLDRISERVDRATEMIRQLLMLARLEADQFQETHSETNLNSLLIDEIANIAHLLVDSGRDIEFTDSGPVIIKGDNQLLGVMIKNLLDNALHYCPEKGEIYIQCDANNGGKKQLIIANSTVRITAAQRRKMQETFYRVPGTGGTGSGIGLSIVNRVARIHKADLEINDWKNGKGIEIVLTFP